MSLFEANELPTVMGNVVITVTAPVGYILSYAPSLTSIDVSGEDKNPVAVDG